MLNGTISKFLIAIEGAAVTILTTYYGTSKWEPAVVSAMASVLVYLVPNAPKPVSTASVK
jgi:hypothetical protein